MQELIVLRGASDSGKSSALKRLTHLFLQLESLFTFLGNSGEKAALLSKVAGENWYVKGNAEGSVTDIKKVIFMCGDIKIGITSLGDDWKSVMGQLEYFNNEDCNICICAAHPTVAMDEKIEIFRKTSGCKTVSSVYKYSLKKGSPDQQRFFDKIIACELFAKVTEAVRRCTE